MKRIFLILGLMLYLFNSCNDYKIIKGSYVIDRTLRANEGPCYISGTVLSKLDDNPIHGAMVVLEKNDLFMFTDENGNFSFNVSPGTYKLEITCAGYHKLTIDEITHSCESFLELTVKLGTTIIFD
jgi:uncharacterized membrane protein